MPPRSCRPAQRAALDRTHSRDEEEFRRWRDAVTRGPQDFQDSMKLLESKKRRLRTKVAAKENEVKILVGQLRAREEQLEREGLLAGEPSVDAELFPAFDEGAVEVTSSEDGARAAPPAAGPERASHARRPTTAGKPRAAEKKPDLAALDLAEGGAPSLKRRETE